MAMKKTLNSDAEVIILGQNKNSFPPGYKYILGQREYTVLKAFTADNTEMRRLVDQKGDVEEVTLETLRRDTMEHDFTQLPPDENIARARPL